MAKTLSLTGDQDADQLLSTDPLALVIGMQLDQQFPMERAFASPGELACRLGISRLEPATLARMKPEQLAEVFAAPPALHRYPRSMSRRVQDLSRVVDTQFGGDAAAIWRTSSSGHDLLRRLESLPGFGNRKARIFVALLGKQLGVRPKGWRQASKPYGDPGSFRSIADVVDAESLARVREVKQVARAAADSATR